jgi:hypothetical protein
MRDERHMIIKKSARSDRCDCSETSHDTKTIKKTATVFTSE